VNFKLIKDKARLHVANSITIFGMKLCFALVLMVILYRERVNTIVLLGLVILLTDYLDGEVARCLGTVSRLGANLDRYRDKFFLLAMFFWILVDERINPLIKYHIWPLAAIEICLLVQLTIGVIKDKDVPAGVWGKRKMLVVSIGVMACPTMVIFQEHGLKVPFFVDYILVCIFLVSIFLGAMSLIKHIAHDRRQSQSPCQ
jgi:phosphatidylglycerophosphate synthase